MNYINKNRWEAKLYITLWIGSNLRLKMILIFNKIQKRIYGKKKTELKIIALHESIITLFYSILFTLWREKKTQNKLIFITNRR